MRAGPSPAPVHLYDGRALRALEAAATGDLGGDGYALMQRAGQAGWRALLRHWPDARRIVVACGPGNNGGDGYLLAWHALRCGREAVVLRLPEHAPRSALARRACAAYADAGGRTVAFAGALPAADVLVDAVFGIGLARAPDPDCAALLEAFNAAGVPVLALDAPSGVATDSGGVPGAAIRADVTVQFMAAHAGLHTGPALDRVGRRMLADLDVPQALLDGLRPAAVCLGAADLPGRFAPRPRNAHKGDAGHVLCVGGDSGKGGAVLLAAEAALRCGAGLVSVATRAAHVAPMLARRPEAMVQAVEDADALAALLGRADVVAVGPGLGTSAWSHALFAAALGSGKPLVLDADALNLLAERGDAAPGDAILTPHPGEAARLLAVSTAQVQADRYAAAARLCERYGCTVVLKGAGTVIAAPGERPVVVGAGNPGMGVGGMGDVLTGVIASLRGQDRPAADAAATGALLHAVAGDLAAADGGERGLLPSDLFPWLRRRVNP